LKSVNISLTSIIHVKTFVNILAMYPGDFDISSARYVVDAKSIMGIFSLDLSQPLLLNIHDDSNADEVLESLKEFIVE